MNSQVQNTYWDIIDNMKDQSQYFKEIYSNIMKVLEMIKNTQYWLIGQFFSISCMISHVIFFFITLTITSHPKLMNARWHSIMGNICFHQYLKLL